MLAALFPDRMLSLVMAEVERMANDLLPVAQRAPRVAAQRVEEVLVADAIAAGQPVHRAPSATPTAVLGVRVADRASRSRRTVRAHTPPGDPPAPFPSVAST
jgi:hypothetical protein